MPFVAEPAPLTPRAKLGSSVREPAALPPRAISISLRTCRILEGSTRKGSAALRPGAVFDRYLIVSRGSTWVGYGNRRVFFRSSTEPLASVAASRDLTMFLPAVLGCGTSEGPEDKVASRAENRYLYVRCQALTGAAGSRARLFPRQVFSPKSS